MTFIFKRIAFFGWGALSLPLKIQGQLPAFFIRTDTVPIIVNGAALPMAWSGGLNYVQIHSIDLNYDGLNDLITFDRTGHRLLPFLNIGAPGQMLYRPAPEYRPYFPDGLQAWTFFTDYDKDGRVDLFTYKNGSAAVYRNIGSAPQGLSFQLVKPVLMSNYGNFTTGIYISGADYPVFADLDKDGDLDVLNFNVLGACLEMHKNLSREWYGHSDSLIFKLHTDNWGHVVEDPNNNTLYLNDSCDGQFIHTYPGPPRHGGSTLMSLDANGDGRMDLVVGDLSYPTLTLLLDNGPPGTAIIGSQNPQFPAGLGTSVPVNLAIFPAAFYTDVNNDGRRDLLASPNFNVNSENARSLWLYLNEGWDSLPSFQFWGTDFLQKDMLDVGEGAYPVFHDVDGDGLLDLTVGNGNIYQSGQSRSRLYFFRNTGTPTQPVFELMTSDLAGLLAGNYQNITPTFGDLDADGDADLLFGESTGRLYWYENSGTNGGIPQFVLKQSGVGFIQEPQFSAPQLVDLDEDGLLDIVCGHRLGKLNFYKNTGTPQLPGFSSTPTIADLGQVNVIDSALSFNSYSVPWFFKTSGGQWELFVGSHNGRIFHYSNIAGNLSGAFQLVTPAFLGLREGARTAVSLADINSDGLPDLVVGNYCGGLTLFMGSATASQMPGPEPTVGTFQVYPNPTSQYVHVKTPCHNLEVLDLQGRVLQRALQAPVDIGHLNPGFYLIRASCDGQKALTRFIKY
ncbi:MAG: T9SS type A sorting domain-containing protein [Flavobacteriales bacterium]|nr:T9SS type A sorting domain-containing protein [Flavobacteriales bacterium]MDW8432978.1 T9SS type A sorting domain-containing protein [Flavobacteriales bacterium]